MKNILSVFAGVLFIVGFIPYIRAILKRESKPSKASWIIWASLDTIILAGMIAEHSVNGQIIGAVIGAWTVAFLAMKYGTPGWTKLDKFCLSSMILGIMFWKIFSNPVLGIVISSSVIFIGAVPTFISTWHDSNRENRTAWTIAWLSCVMTVIAIPFPLTLANTLQPATFFVVESVMMYLLYIRRAKRCGI